MEKIKCKYCEKVIEGYTKKQVEYMLKQHILSRHKQNMPLNERTFECEECGMIKNRDLNASINIKKLTENKLNNTFGQTEFQACGDTVRPCFEFEKIQDKASVCEAGNYLESSSRSP